MKRRIEDTSQFDILAELSSKFWLLLMEFFLATLDPGENLEREDSKGSR